MRTLVVTAHPLEESFHAALGRTIVQSLQEAGHEVDLCDLYAEDFQPVLDAQMRSRYFDPSVNRTGVEQYVERLFAAQALVMCFPVWCFGPPAILKGFMDRVLIPGVSFALGEDGRMHPNLRHIRHLVGVTTYGRSRLDAWYIGDPPRRIVTRYLPWFMAKNVRVRYLPLYNLHRSDAAQPAQDQSPFLHRVARAMKELEG